jgi:hypothetical protein
VLTPVYHAEFLQRNAPDMPERRKSAESLPQIYDTRSSRGAQSGLSTYRIDAADAAFMTCFNRFAFGMPEDDFENRYRRRSCHKRPFGRLCLQG